MAGFRLTVHMIMGIATKKSSRFCPPDITKLREDQPTLPVANVPAEQALLGAVLFETAKHFETIAVIVAFGGAIS